MSKAEFDAFVRSQQAEKGEQASFNPQQQLDEWLHQLEILFEKIQAYLHTYVENGTATFTRRAIQLNEEFIGSYSVSEAVLKIGRSTVTFTPIGTMLIGTKGRVDVQGPLGKARLVLVDREVTDARHLIRVTVSRVGESTPAPRPQQTSRPAEWTWKLGTPPPEIKFIDLTEDTFFSMILAVANG
jgi:hypothetical protein